MEQKEYYITFSKEQKSKKVKSDREIKKKLKEIGVDFIITKKVHYITNDVDSLDLTGDDEITQKIKQAINEIGRTGIIDI